MSIFSLIINRLKCLGWGKILCMITSNLIMNNLKKRKIIQFLVASSHQWSDWPLSWAYRRNWGFCRGLLIAAKIIEDGLLSDFVRERYGKSDLVSGKQVMSGQSNFAELEKLVLENGEPILLSGRQEYLGNIIKCYIWSQSCFLLWEQSDSFPAIRKACCFYHWHGAVILSFYILGLVNGN